jgi:hypothetical protein
MRRSRSRSTGLTLLALFASALSMSCVPGFQSRSVRETQREARLELFSDLRPSKLTNCTLKRYGDAHDGGYLLCENLLGAAQAVYSYGIDGRDKWGCDVSKQIRRPVHEYDCFNPTRPSCDGGTLLFHDECVGPHQATQKGRQFDTVSSQIARNQDDGKHLIVKMDVEGAEWASLLATPDSVLAMIDQLAIEFHHVDDWKFVATVERLKRFFYVAHFHANNYACARGIEPFTSWANEALLVSKRIGQLDPSGSLPTLPNPLDASNTVAAAPCQPAF